MINRASIQVEGPPCSGKTSLIERLLESNRSKRISAIRFLESGSLDNPVEDRSGNEENDSEKREVTRLDSKNYISIAQRRRVLANFGD